MDNKGEGRHMEGEPTRDLETDITIQDLAMLVKQLCRSVNSGNITDADKLKATQAMGYLKRKGLQGSPLRVVAHETTDGEAAKPWVTEWNAKVPRYNMVAKADGAYPRETADGEYVLWTDHFAKLQELLKDHGDAAIQEINRLLNENAELKADRDLFKKETIALVHERTVSAWRIKQESGTIVFMDHCNALSLLEYEVKSGRVDESLPTIDALRHVYRSSEVTPLYAMPEEV